VGRGQTQDSALAKLQLLDVPGFGVVGCLKMDVDVAVAVAGRKHAPVLRRMKADRQIGTERPARRSIIDPSREVFAGSQRHSRRQPEVSGDPCCRNLRASHSKNHVHAIEGSSKTGRTQKTEADAKHSRLISKPFPLPNPYPLT
jgi:hypothetical protein